MWQPAFHGRRGIPLISAGRLCASEIALGLGIRVARGGSRSMARSGRCLTAGFLNSEPENGNLFSSRHAGEQGLEVEACA